MQISKMQKKRVLNIIYSGTGGHGSVWYSLMHGGGFEKWDNYIVFYGVEDVVLEYKLFCQKHKITFLVLKKNSLLDIKNWLKFIRFVRHNKINNLILHQHSIFFPVLIIKLFKWADNLIYVEHTPHEILRRIDKFFIPLMFRIVDKVVFLNDTILEHYKMQNPTLSNIMEIIPNGINHKLYTKIDKNIPKSHFSIGMISRMTPQKDFDTLILAYKVLKEKFENITLSLGGDGIDKVRILKLIENEGLSSEINYLGLLNQSESIEFYQNLDVFVLSSKSEGMPMVILEAMACCTAVIASDVNGSNFIIQDKKNGILFSQGNIHELVEKITLLYSNLELRNKLADSGYYTATQVFSMENMFNKYNNLIQK
jgi:glycosyltransferase involved in cell wall biosynthesis